MKKLILIDGSNVMFRAYYGTAYSGNLMKNSKGQYTNAIFAFVNMMNAILAEDFTHIMVAFDMSGETFRHEDYKEYKAGRAKMPEEFRSQIELIKESLTHLGVVQKELHLIEADDIIGTYAVKYYDEFDEIEIISNDKDLLQLVNDKVRLRSSQRGGKEDKIYTPELLLESMGITASLVPDLKGLMGDPSDNLPGIPGVGEKTAVKLLQEYGTLENVLANRDNIKGKLGERIREHYQDAILCKKIATIKTDVEKPFVLEEVEYKGPNEESMISFFKELELHSLIKKFNRTNKAEPKKDVRFKLVEDPYQIEEYLIDESYLVLESYNPYYHEAKGLGFAIVNKKGAIFVPYDVIGTSMAFQLYLADENMKKYVFDAKRMKVILNNDGYELGGISFDLLLAAYLLNPNNTKEDFRVIVSNFDYTDVSYHEEVYGKGAKYHIPVIERYGTYGIKKAYAIQALHKELIDKLKKNNQLALLEEIELPCALILADMEREGILVDKQMLQNLDKTMQQQIDDLTREIHEQAGVEFNIASPKQLGEILFEKLQLPFKKRTKTGYSTGADILEKLQPYHPIIDNIMQYRMLTKLHSTYVNGLENAILKRDGRIHTIYRQAFTSTGRLSSVEPNLQNIPIKYKEGREIRKVFIPSENHVLLASDYSQIELRVLAHMADEKVLIKAFQNNEDIHTKTAQLIFGKETINAKERRAAKAVNFGIIYGQTSWGLSEGIDITPKEADRFIKTYYERFPGIKVFMDTVVEQAKNEGYVETLYHRRRYIPELTSSVYMQREAGKRNAMNAPIQGTAADIIKIAMVKIAKEMKKQRLRSKILLQIHDELVFEVHKEELEKMTSLVKDVMEHAVSLQVPLKVDYAIGDNLYETK